MLPVQPADLFCGPQDLPSVFLDFQRLPAADQELALKGRKYGLLLRDVPLQHIQRLVRRRGRPLESGSLSCGIHFAEIPVPADSIPIDSDIDFQYAQALQLLQDRFSVFL